MIIFGTIPHVVLLGSVLTSTIFTGLALVGAAARGRAGTESVFAYRARLDRERSAAVADPTQSIA
jgi:hypothetical protein